MPLNKRDRVIVRVWTSDGNEHAPGENVGHVSVETPMAYMSLWPASQGAVPKGEMRERILPEKLLAYTRKAEHTFLPSYEPDYDSDPDLTPEENARARANVPCDRNWEAREPEFTLSFYSLDHEEIEAEFDIRARRVEGWHLLGSTLLYGGTTESCVTFAHEMLKAGGIDRLVPRTAGAPIGSSEHTARHIEPRSSIGRSAQKSSRTSQSASDSVPVPHSVFTTSSVTPDSLLTKLIDAKKREWDLHPETREWLEPDDTQELPEKNYHTGMFIDKPARATAAVVNTVDSFAAKLAGTW